jgi:Fe-S-cluster-containing dehydrogenase component/DMSO reductase anchor subunit
MSKGFLFDHTRCVACNACTAACILENGWSIHPRVVYSYNSEAFQSLPVLNLSLACNHCETATCLEGCPSASYFRDTLTGAVIIESTRCIGCKYCKWNCPYDAPKFDTENRVIEKCNFCYTLLNDSISPACTTSCPTGALKFGDLTDTVSENIPPWFPDKQLNPSIKFISGMNEIPLRIFPEESFERGIQQSLLKTKSITGELSLLLFSFLTTLSVGILISSLIWGTFPSIIVQSTFLLLAGLISLSHLGKPLRAWRAVINLKRSPLSREIVLFGIYFLISLITVFFQLPGMLIVSSMIGLILLISIDSVYVYSDKRKSTILHSGQAFLTSLLIVSFLTRSILPFVFIAIIKLISSSYLMIINKNNGMFPGIRFVRIALLIITGSCLVSSISSTDPVLISLFLTGEFIDRLIYYYDFDPVNIQTLINKQVIDLKNEKKSS